MLVYQQGWRSGGFVRIGSRGGNPLCGARGRGDRVSPLVSLGCSVLQPSGFPAQLPPHQTGTLQPTSRRQNQPGILRPVMSPHATALMLLLAAAWRETAWGWAGLGWLPSIADAGWAGYFSSWVGAADLLLHWRIYHTARILSGILQRPSLEGTCCAWPPCSSFGERTPSCAGLCFSPPSLCASGLFCEEKQQFNQSPSWQVTVCACRRGEDEGKGARSHLWQRVSGPCSSVQPASL